MRHDEPTGRTQEESMSDTDLVGAGEYQGELIEVKKYSSLSSGVSLERTNQEEGLAPAR